MKIWDLSRVPDGKRVTVREILLGGETRRRFYELGLLPGTQVTCLHRAPSGSPIAFEVRGAAIAIRSRDAAQIRTEPWT